MFILVSVVNREALVQAFKTMEEAKEKMASEFYAVDGIEECLAEDKAALDETSAWCNADGGDVQYDWDIFEVAI